MTISTLSSKFSHINVNPLELVNIQPLVAALVHSYKWNEIQAISACQRYLQFLHLLQLYPGRLLIPTQDIDCVWHCHILCTQKYRQDCEILFGHYLDHDPELNFEQMPDQSLLYAFQQTRALFEQHFGIGSFDGSSNNCDDDPAACGCPFITL